MWCKSIKFRNFFFENLYLGKQMILKKAILGAAAYYYKVCMICVHVPAVSWLVFMPIPLPALMSRPRISAQMPKTQKRPIAFCFTI